MIDIASKLAEVSTMITACEQQYAREPGSVCLIAVSKRQPASALRAAYNAGQRAFGENYLQEALAKQAELTMPDLEWHFIGAIQSNKTADIARAFDWVHSVERIKTARRLNDQRPNQAAPLNVLIQVNISAETSKAGVGTAALPQLLEQVAALPRLRLRGLMALPALASDHSGQRRAFAELAALAKACPHPLDTLSMGTSDDFAAAIAEGATMLRLGTAVFGPRPGPA
jgi:pyridoxal phosphate enzyme (YggS family)